MSATLSLADPVEEETLQPTDEVGLWLHRHEHEWVWVGSSKAPIGSWHPVFRCLVCTDVIEDMNQVLHVDPEYHDNVVARNTADYGPDRRRWPRDPHLQA